MPLTKSGMMPTTSKTKKTDSALTISHSSEADITRPSEGRIVGSNPTGGAERTSWPRLDVSPAEESRGSKGHGAG